jgi:glycosyltransferase involved in cell wall biosynthesis
VRCPASAKCFQQTRLGETGLPVRRGIPSVPVAGALFLGPAQVASRVTVLLKPLYMPRIAVSIVSTLARLGPVNVLKGIVGHLDSRNYRPVVITLSPEASNTCIEDFLASGVAVKQLNMSRVSSLVTGRRALKLSIDLIGADLVHCHGFRADFLVASSGLRCPVMSTIHADLLFDYQLGYGRLAGKLMARREYAALHKTDAVVAVSETAARRAAEFGLRPEVIPNGIDLSIYVPPSDDGEVRRARGPLGWPQDRVVVLHTGALIRLKQPLGVIESFQRSNLSRNAVLVFAGDGPLLVRCKQAAKDCPNIIFLGHRSDLPDLLRAADVVVSNSTSEGLPMALLEACACGLRILASDIEAHRYTAGLFPEQVDLFPVGEGSALTDRLNALSRSGAIVPVLPPAASLQAISAERMSRRYQDVYDRVLS